MRFRKYIGTTVMSRPYIFLFKVTFGKGSIIPTKITMDCTAVQANIMLTIREPS